MRDPLHSNFPCTFVPKPTALLAQTHALKTTTTTSSRSGIRRLGNKDEHKPFHYLNQLQCYAPSSEH